MPLIVHTFDCHRSLAGARIDRLLQRGAAQVARRTVEDDRTPRPLRAP
jgi:hypothetical protein